jgi:hypothetical protein
VAGEGLRSLAELDDATPPRLLSPSELDEVKIGRDRGHPLLLLLPPPPVGRQVTIQKTKSAFRPFLKGVSRALLH